MAHPEYEPYLELLRKCFRKQEFEVDLMIEQWDLNNVPLEDREQQFWALIDGQRRERKDLWKSIENSIGEQHANTNNY